MGWTGLGLVILGSFWLGWLGLGRAWLVWAGLAGVRLDCVRWSEGG